MKRERSHAGSKLETFDPLRSPSKPTANATGTECSPDPLGQSDLLLQQQAMDLNNAAEKFMAELDQSEKKRFYEREKELNAMAAGRPGMVSALGRDFFEKEEERSASVADAGEHYANQMANVHANSQSSQGTSKFREEDGEQQQRYSNGGVEARGSPGNPYRDDAERMTEVQPNVEGTISRYLVGQGHDSVSRGGNNTLQRNTGRDLLESNRNAQNRASHEFGQSSRHGSYKKSSAYEYLQQQQSKPNLRESLNDPSLNLAQISKQAAMKQSSQGDLRAPANLFGGVGGDDGIKKYDKSLHEGDQSQKEEAGLPAVEMFRYQTVQPHQDSVNQSNFGTADANANAAHVSKLAYANSNSQIPTIQSRDYLNMHSDNGTEKPNPNREKNQYMQSPPDLARQAMAQSSLSQQVADAAAAPTRMDTFNGQASLNSSMALNQRIRKLREELDHHHNPLLQSDVGPAAPLHQFQSTNFVTNDNYLTGKSPKRIEDETLDSRMRRAQMQTERLLEKVRSRSPMSGSRVSQRSAIYVETKRSQSKSISKVVSNATDVELPLGKISDSQALSRHTDDLNQHLVNPNEEQAANREAGDRHHEVRLHPGSPEPYQNLELPEGSVIVADGEQTGGPKDGKRHRAMRSHEASLDRTATPHSMKRAGSSRKRMNQKSASLRSRNLSYSNLHTMNSGAYEMPRHVASKKSLRSGSSRAAMTAKEKTRSKSVKFSRAVSQRQKKSGGEGGTMSKELAAQDPMQLDQIYRELIKRERLEFERILKTKQMAVRHDTENKMRKQIEQAEQKLQKVADLERRLAFAQKNSDKLRTDWNRMKQQLGQSRQQLELWQGENKVLRTKLDDLWEKFEEEKDLVMLVTKSEVEKAKGEEIAVLKERIEALETEKSHVVEQLGRATSAENEKSSQEAEASALKAEVSLFRSKCERLEVENRRLKQELEISQAAQMEELKQKYDSMKLKYREMARATGMRSEIDTQRLKNDIHADKIGGGRIPLDKTANQSQPLLSTNKKLNLAAYSEKPPRQSETQLAGDDLPPSARFQDWLASDKAHVTMSSKQEVNQNMARPRGSSHFNTHADNQETIKSSSHETFNAKQAGSRDQSRTKRGKQAYQTERVPEKAQTQDQAELWQLRCKLLAEKYFSIIKDLKRSLKKLKASNKAEIERLRKEMSDQVHDQLRGYITRLEERRATKSSRLTSRPEEQDQAEKPLSRARSGSRKRNDKKASQETFKTQTNRLSSTIAKLNSDIDHLNEYSKESSEDTLQNRPRTHPDSVPSIPVPEELAAPRPASSATVKIPQGTRNPVTPAFQSHTAELADIEAQKRDLEEMIAQQQWQIDQQQEELDKLKRRVSASTPGHEEAKETTGTQSIEETVAKPSLGQDPEPNPEIQVTVGEANESDAHRLAQQLRTAGAVSRDSRQAALASNPSSAINTGSLNGVLSTTTHPVATAISNRVATALRAPPAIPASAADNHAHVYETKGLFNNTQRVAASGMRTDDRNLSPDSNLPYKSKFAQNYSRLASLTGGHASTHLSMDQKIQLEKIRSQYSSASGSRDRAVHQVAMVNGQQHQMVSLRAPLHAVQHQYQSSSSTVAANANPLSTCQGSFRVGIAGSGSRHLKEPGIASSLPSTTHALLGGVAGPLQPAATQPSIHDYAAVANLYNLSRESRSPIRSGEPLPQQLLPQVLQGSPNSPFQEHLRRMRANSGNQDGIRSDNERSSSLARGGDTQPAGEQMAGLKSQLSPNAAVANPSSVTNVYQLRSETQSEVAKIDAALSRLQNVNQMTSNLASPQPESYTPGSLSKQVGGYPMHFQPAEYYNIQEEESSRIASNHGGPEGNVSFQHPTPPDNTISLAKFAQKERTLSLDKFAQRMAQAEENPSLPCELRDPSQLDSFDRASHVQSHKSVLPIVASSSNLDPQASRHPQQVHAAPNLQQHSVPNLKSASLRYVGAGGSKGLQHHISASQKSNQYQIETMKRGRASSTKSVKNTSKKHSRGQSVTSNKSGKRSTVRSPHQQQQRLHHRRKSSVAAEQSKSSIKSKKSRASCSRSPRGQGLAQVAALSIPKDNEQAFFDPSQVNTLNRTLQQTQTYPASQVNATSAAQSQAGLDNMTSIPSAYQVMLPTEGPSYHRNQGAEFSTANYMQYIAPPGNQNEIGSSAVSIQQQSGPTTIAANQPESKPGVNMSTFERLNEEIQKSINSLKAMSQQKAINLQMFQQTDNFRQPVNLYSGSSAGGIPQDGRASDSVWPEMSTPGTLPPASTMPPSSVPQIAQDDRSMRTMKGGRGHVSAKTQQSFESKSSKAVSGKAATSVGQRGKKARREKER